MVPESKLLVLPQASRYAISAVACLAASDETRYHMVQELAQSLNVSSSYLAKVMQNLAHKGLLTSRRGTRGGYRLAKRAKRLTLAEVVMASLHPGTEPAQCMLEARPCGGDNPCALHAIISRSERAWWTRLKKTTVDRLSRNQAMFLKGTPAPQMERQ